MSISKLRIIRQWILWATLLLALIVSIPTFAQDDGVTFSGTVTEVTGTTIVVGGVAVDVSGAVLPVDGVAPGTTVQVIGAPDGQVIRATIIVIVVTDDEAEVTPEATEAPEVTPEATEPSESPEATAEATEPPASNPDIVINTNAPIIVIEGPVQEINITSITIFDIDIQVDPADPILTEIRIGDTIRVEGQSSLEGNTVIIVAVNITIVETTIIVINNVSPAGVYVPVGIPSNCRVKKSGKITCKNSRRSGSSRRS